MKIFSKLHLRNKIFLCMLFVSYITLFATFTFVYLIFQQDTEDKMLDSYNLNISQLSDKLSYIFLDMRNIANTLSANEIILNDLQEYYETDNDLQQIFIRQHIEDNLPQKANNYSISLETLLFTTHGDIFYSGAQSYFRPYSTKEFLTQDWFLQSEYNSGNLGWMDSSQFENEATLSPYFYITRNLANPYNNTKLGTLRIGFNEAFIQHELHNVLGIPYTAYIVNNEGYVISGTDNETLGTVLNTDLNNAIAENKTSFSTNGENNFLITSQVVNTPWQIVFIVPSSTFQADTSQLLINLILIMLMGLVLSAILSYYLSSTIIKPINTLIEKVKQIDAGNLKIEIGELSQDEIGLLGRTISDMAMSIDKMMDHLMKKEREKNEAEMKFLRTQINPHFLHNTLKTLPYLVQQGRSEEMSSIVIALTRILKESMVGQATMIPLSKELDLLRDYLLIMQMRYNYSFDFSFETPEEFFNILIPRLSLQPIFENAILHAADLDNSTTLYLKLNIDYAEDDNEKVHIKIIDNGCGITNERLDYINNVLLSKKLSDKNDKQSIGIPNIATRLNFYYKNTYMRFESTLGEGTCVNLIIPIINEEE